MGRLDEMREDLDGWIDGKKAMIRDKEKLRKARDGKELSPADKQVKKYLPNHLLAHWLDLLRDDKRFDDDAKWNFAAGIEAETEQLRISSVSLDLSKAPLDRLAKVASKLSLLTKQMIPYIKKAKEAEAGEGEPDVVESPYDLEFLRDLDLGNIADDLEAQTRKENEPDGKEAPQDEPAERDETDLTTEVNLPIEDATPPTKDAKTPIEEPEQSTTPAPAPASHIKLSSPKAAKGKEGKK